MKRSLLLFGLLFIAACKGEAPPSPRPEFAPPSTTPAAEARVEASSGPIRIILEVHQTRVRLSDWKGALYFRASVVNTGTENISLNRREFDDPFKFSQRRPPGLYLMLRDEAAHPVSPLVRIHGHDPHSVLDDGLTREQRDTLRHLAENPQERTASTSTLDAVTLRPGQSIATPTWLFDDEGRVKRVQGFSQVPFDIREAGRYSLVLVFDRRPSPEMLRIYRELGMEVPPSSVRVETPALSIEILP